MDCPVIAIRHCVDGVKDPPQVSSQRLKPFRSLPAKDRKGRGTAQARLIVKYTITFHRNDGLNRVFSIFFIKDHLFS